MTFRELQLDLIELALAAVPRGTAPEVKTHRVGSTTRLSPIAPGW